MSVENLFPLSQATTQYTVTVAKLKGDRALCSRLLSLGFTPGTKVCVCSPPSPCGQCHIIIRNCQLVLDKTAAAAIICSNQALNAQCQPCNVGQTKSCATNCTGNTLKKQKRCQKRRRWFQTRIF